jgi:hypothetical protein
VDDEDNAARQDNYLRYRAKTNHFGQMERFLNDHQEVLEWTVDQQVTSELMF